MKNDRNYINQLCMIAVSGIAISSCAILGIENEERIKPISNPFNAYRPDGRNDGSPMVLRSRKGDRSVEVEVPSGGRDLSSFVLPVNTQFKDGVQVSPSDLDPSSAPPDESYKDKLATPTDREITSTFSSGSPEDESKRKEIERGLKLMPTTDELSELGTPSYLAKVDHIKQLYRSARFEAALLETDDMIRQYQTDPKLHEMRGTLLERMGRRELALKSWKQALKLNPQNNSLKRFIDRKSYALSGGGGG